EHDRSLFYGRRQRARDRSHAACRTAPDPVDLGPPRRQPDPEPRGRRLHRPHRQGTVGPGSRRLGRISKTIGGTLMGAAQLVVRAEVPDQADRAPFDHWYATDHLPWAIRVFGARRGWRGWSRAAPVCHYAFYEFADLAEAQAATGSEKIAPLIADFDRVWGNRVPRRREI